MTRIGGEFTFGAYSTLTGSAVLAIWKEELAASWPTIPNAFCHFVINPTQWSYGIWDRSPGSNLVVIASGGFATPLAADGATVHRAEVFIDGSTSTLFLPDGSVRTVTDSRIASKGGNYACWEVYASTASTDAKAGFVRTWADTNTPKRSDKFVTPATLLEVIKQRAPLARRLVAQWAPTGANDVTVPNAEADVSAGNLELTFTAPESGKVLVELSACLAMSGSGQVLWGVRNGNTTLFMQTVVNQQFTGTVVTRKLLTLAAGTVYTIRWRHWSVQSGVATLKANTGMTVDPV